MEQTAIINALALKAKNTCVTVQDVRDLLDDVRGVSFAQVVSVTDVDTAAKYKDVSIKKVTSANVQVFNNLKNFDVFAKAVKRDTGVEDWVQGETWYEHTDCFSLVAHKTTGEQYLYAIYNGADSAYLINGVQASKQEVAQYLTAGAANKLLGNGRTYNATNNVEHGVTVRVLKLASIVSISAKGDIVSL
jgi:hypothetical protein